MKTKFVGLVAALALMAVLSGFMFKKKVSTTPESGLREVLLAQLKKTHTQKEWFVPIKVALDGVTAEQALWNDKSGNHSIGQLTYHLMFWNKRELETFKGVKLPQFAGKNDETFTAFDKAGWTDLVTQLDKVMTDLETVVANASDAQLKEWAPNVANISTHNAYHTGQIVYVRRLQGSWDPEKGVK